MYEFSEYEEQKIEEAKQIYPEYDTSQAGHAFKNQSGLKYGRLRVLYRTNDKLVGRQQVRKSNYVCLCECGNIITTIAENLKNGNVQSCKCLQAEKRIDNNKRFKKRYNKYDLVSQDYGIGYTAKNEHFFFDKEDYELIKNISWSIDTQGYVCSRVFVEDHYTHIKLHRLVMNAQEGEYVDHINHNEADNRKINLRITTNQENCMNRTPQCNNKTGVPGVRRAKTKKEKWIARMNINKKEVYLGQFDTFEEAVAARRKAEEQYYKDYSYTNSLKIAEKYSIT